MTMGCEFKVMDDINDFKCYEQLKVVHHMKDFES